MADRRSKTSPANGAQGHGPVTVAGKLASSGNARTHGILSRELLLPTEDPAEFQLLLDELILDLKPSGTLELTLVERIAMTLWRQRRFARAERAQIVLAQFEEAAEKSRLHRPADDLFKAIEEGYEQIGPLMAELKTLSAQPRVYAMTIAEFAKAYPLTTERLFRTEESMTPADWVEAQNETVRECLGDLDAWISTQYAELTKPLPKALERDLRGVPAETEKLSRYQSALDNELYKAMRALRQAQAWRREMVVPDG